MWLWNHNSEFTKWQHLQCGSWLWDDTPWNAPKRPPYWTILICTYCGAILIWFWPYHRSRHVILNQSANFFYPNQTTFSRKNDVMSIFKMADLSHLGFYGPEMGSLKSPCTTSYRSSIETIALNCLAFEKIAFFCILAIDRQTVSQMDSIDALSRPRCCERRLYNRHIYRAHMQRLQRRWWSAQTLSRRRRVNTPIIHCT